MNPDDENNEYDPAGDDNQGVAQLMAQQDEANTGVSQVGYMSPAINQGAEPAKEEVSDQSADEESGAGGQ